MNAVREYEYSASRGLPIPSPIQRQLIEHSQGVQYATIEERRTGGTCLATVLRRFAAQYLFRELAGAGGGS